MHLSQVRISNFRNFRHLEVQLGPKTVVVGENNVGKSNLLHALRLLLDPALPDSARHLRVEDFWDGHTNPLKQKELIEVVVEIQGVEDNKSVLAVLQQFLVETTPPTVRLNYQFRPRSPLPAARDLTIEDYEFVVFGGADEKNRVDYNVRRWIPLDVLPALRDAEADLSSWQRSPLRPLINRLQVPEDTLISVANGIDAATGQLIATGEMKALEQSIVDRLGRLIGQFAKLDPSLGFASTKPERLLRTLRMFGDGGERRPIGDLSLGFLNVLYLALLAVELENKERSGERARTLLAIEEPEAHLHPHLQRLLFRDFLQRESPLFLTTHSPHIASVSPLQSLLLLREESGGGQTTGHSAIGVSFTELETADIERYLDATRAEMLFARGIILVEGAAELFIVPALAEKMGYPLDEYGITVCSVHGTDFVPYAKLLSPTGLGIPFVVITDGDWYETQGKQQSRGLTRAGTIAVQLGADRDELRQLHESDNWLEFAKKIEEHGIFVGEDSLEPDLITAGLLPEVRVALGELRASARTLEAMDAAIAASSSLGPEELNRATDAIERIGKGRFAQRLAGSVDPSRCPVYLKRAIERVISMVRPT